MLYLLHENIGKNLLKDYYKVEKLFKGRLESVRHLNRGIYTILNCLLERRVFSSSDSWLLVQGSSPPPAESFAGLQSRMY